MPERRGKSKGKEEEKTRFVVGVVGVIIVVFVVGVRVDDRRCGRRQQKGKKVEEEDEEVKK